MPYASMSLENKCIGRSDSVRIIRSHVKALFVSLIGDEEGLVIANILKLRDLACR
jgi:hypothetical protein